MVPLAVELPQFTAEVGADVPHDLSQRVRISSVNTPRRHFGAKTKCAGRVWTTLRPLRKSRSGLISVTQVNARH